MTFDIASYFLGKLTTWLIILLAIGLMFLYDFIKKRRSKRMFEERFER